MVTKTR